MASAAVRTRESEWEAHREEITRLYWDEKMTQKNVADFMSKEHGFSASKWQYERHFNLWNLRKKHSKETWVALNGMPGQFELASSLVFHGRAIEAKKRNKARLRYPNSATLQGTTNTLPPGFELVNCNTTLAPMIESAYVARILSVRLTPLLLSFQLFRGFNEAGKPTKPLMSLRKVMATLDREASLPPTEDTAENGTVVTSSRVLKIMPGEMDRASAQAIFPWAALEEWHSGSDPLMVTAIASQHMASSQVDQARLHLLVFALSNGMERDMGIECLGDVWQYLQQSSAFLSRNSLQQIMQGPYSKTLCSKLLQGAIEAGNASGCSQIIRLGNIRVDDVVCFGEDGELLAAVELAALLGNVQVLEALLKENADPTRTGPHTERKFDIIAKFIAEVGVLKTLAAHAILLVGPHPNPILTEAVERGDCALLQLCLNLLQPELQPQKLIADVYSDIPSEYRDAMVDTILQYRSPYNSTRNTVRIAHAVIAAAENGDMEIAQKLLPHDANVYTSLVGVEELKDDMWRLNETSLIGAIIERDQTPGNQFCVYIIRKFCTPCKIDRWAATADGEISTPLLLAIDRGLQHIVELLVLEYGADVNFTPRLSVRYTPLQLAAKCGHSGIVRWLLEHGARANSPVNHYYHGMTALYLAAMGGYCGIMEMLINAGADLNDQRFGLSRKTARTALEIAALYGRINAVQLLLDSGFDIRTRGKEAMAHAIELAQEYGHVSVVELLEHYQMDVLFEELWQHDIALEGGQASMDEIVEM
ncbi:ankyrin repeat-containing domain protein [Microdochium trichocladiopsis]|uniref:Ankyrin repeat-containing domain protein n=1 Tax=Microdochium trichocladiopsis TaxID=1682393 RepID=A0A9P8Y474_9PEZI|nr:ankyrin repeat-containing domain protein [Microdochium trichocladiopsis]KAH7028740.1 ankyrin repeat-containing domain protein [Microdochium trichocladiopsis]